MIKLVSWRLDGVKSCLEGGGPFTLTHLRRFMDLNETISKAMLRKDELKMIWSDGPMVF